MVTTPAWGAMIHFQSEITSRFLFNMIEDHFQLTRTLLARLERISADSFWAHRASGVRGSLLRLTETSEHGKRDSAVEMKRLIEMGFLILEQAAMEKIR